MSVLHLSFFHHSAPQNIRYVDNGDPVFSESGLEVRALRIQNSMPKARPDELLSYTGAERLAV